MVLSITNKNIHPEIPLKLALSRSRCEKINLEE